MAKLIKIKGPFKCHTNYIIGEPPKCGDYYKLGTSHKFEGTEEQVTLLIEILKKFKLCKISHIEKHSFIFTSDTIRKQVFSFRICRFIRNQSLTQVLKDTLIINTQYKVIIPNAFVIAIHLNYKNLKYYCSNIDMVIVDKNINFGFKSYREFINHFEKEWVNESYFIYTQIFYPEGYTIYTPKGNVMKSKTTVNERISRTNAFLDALKNKKYKVASKLISERL